MHDDRAAAMQRLRAEGLACTRCDLYLSGTPVVWGEGDPAARVMFIGQGPGEQEAKAGRPFVGPAGELLNALLAESGIQRQRLWITNVIKHWATKRNERGRLVNRDPRAAELRACRIWLDGELAIVQPRLLLCLGAPAAKAVIGKDFRLSEQRGQWFAGPNGTEAMATFHPSYLLRLQANDRAAFERARALVLDDLLRLKARAAEHSIPLA
ncbi:UdgX family uracil-DNA binding protein [Kallotenue papyrolyticum]|uniref:UdgX family uracil-DNA binding protein n=1 Tax=Kallotenue papyrolyticum TaxID=1325125 RepID=UPI00047855D0|nr:UdgX family uracil-DNA binding protein [Kallotenue papyrolyticum]